MGQTTHMRLKEAQLRICNPDPIWKIKVCDLPEKEFADNLNMKILIIAKELEIEIVSEQFLQEWKISDNSQNGKKIVEILWEHKWKGNLKSLQNMRLWFFNQLLDTRGKVLLTWQQIRKLQNRRASGKKAGWFRKLEEIVLDQGEKREVKSMYQWRKSHNIQTTEPELRKISHKKSQKE